MTDGKHEPPWSITYDLEEARDTLRDTEHLAEVPIFPGRSRHHDGVA